MVVKRTGEIMRTLVFVAVVCLSLAALPASAHCGVCGDGGDHGGGHSHAEMAPSADIVAVASSAGSFDTLVTAVQAAGLVETLQSDGPFTVFAPTDAAFAKLPDGMLDSLLANPDKLKQVLLYHVVPGKVMANDVAGLSRATTAEGEDVEISSSGGSVKINNANVVKTDVLASNGVIHVIDSVIVPAG